MPPMRRHCASSRSCHTPTSPRRSSLTSASSRRSRRSHQLAHHRRPGWPRTARRLWQRANDRCARPGDTRSCGSSVRARARDDRPPRPRSRWCSMDHRSRAHLARRARSGSDLSAVRMRRSCGGSYSSLGCTSRRAKWRSATWPAPAKNLAAAKAKELGVRIARAKAAIDAAIVNEATIAPTRFASTRPCSFTPAVTGCRRPPSCAGPTSMRPRAIGYSAHASTAARRCSRIREPCSRSNSGARRRFPST